MITRTDLSGLMEQNQKLTAEKEKLLDERDEHIRTIRKLETRPVEVMAPDKEEIDRLAAERAVGLASARNAELADENAVLKGQINVLQGFINDSVQEDCEMAHHFVESTEAAFEAVIPVYLRLPSSDRNRLCWKLQDLLSHIQDATEVLLVGKDPRFAQDALDEDDEWEGGRDMSQQRITKRERIRDLSNKAEGICQYVGSQNMLFRLIETGNQLASEINHTVALFSNFARTECPEVLMGASVDCAF